MNIIGQNIKRLREEGGLSQRHLSNLCNVGSSYISLMEKPDSKVFSVLSTVENIAHALNVTVPELIGYPIAPIEFTESDQLDITQFSTDELLKEIVRRIS